MVLSVDVARGTLTSCDPSFTDDRCPRPSPAMKAVATADYSVAVACDRISVRQNLPHEDFGNSALFSRKISDLIVIALGSLSFGRATVDSAHGGCCARSGC